MRERLKEEVLKSELKFFESLSEKDKRRYSALEAIKAGTHGVSIVSDRLKIHPHTIREGINELESDSEEFNSERVRIPGGGRKKKS